MRWPIEDCSVSTSPITLGSGEEGPWEEDQGKEERTFASRKALCGVRAGGGLLDVNRVERRRILSCLSDEYS